MKTIKPKIVLCPVCNEPCGIVYSEEGDFEGVGEEFMDDAGIPHCSKKCLEAEKEKNGK